MCEKWRFPCHVLLNDILDLFMLEMLNLELIIEEKLAVSGEKQISFFFPIRSFMRSFSGYEVCPSFIIFVSSLCYFSERQGACPGPNSKVERLLRSL